MLSAVQPSPTHERLRQRTILAARRLDLLQLDWPDEMALLPLGGRRLTADLQRRRRRTGPAGADQSRRDLPGRPHAGGDPGSAGTPRGGGCRGGQGPLRFDRFAPRLPDSSAGPRLRRRSSRSPGRHRPRTRHSVQRARVTRAQGRTPRGSRRPRRCTRRLQSGVCVGSRRPDPHSQGRIAGRLGNDAAAVQEWSLALQARSRASRSLSGPRPFTSGFVTGTWRSPTSSRPPPGPTRIPASSWGLPGPTLNVSAERPDRLSRCLRSHGGRPTTSAAHWSSRPHGLAAPGELSGPAERISQHRSGFPA